MSKAIEQTVEDCLMEEIGNMELRELYRLYREIEGLKQRKTLVVINTGVSKTKLVYNEPVKMVTNPLLNTFTIVNKKGDILYYSDLNRIFDAVIRDISDDEEDVCE